MFSVQLYFPQSRCPDCSHLYVHLPQVSLCVFIPSVCFCSLSCHTVYPVLLLLSYRQETYTPGSFIITLIYYCECQQFTIFPRQSVDQLLKFLTQSHSRAVGIHPLVIMVLGYFCLNKVFLQLIIKQLNVMATFKPLC